jgi:tripartite-type tricarboxylate transporter receptor subunit TctC
MTCCAALVAVVHALLAMAPAAAQDYPSRNVTVVVPYPAGGGTDLFARAIAQQLSIGFGRQFIVDNRGGASGNIGAEAVARAAPDGLTVLYTASPIALSQALYQHLAFDAERDLKPVTMAVSIPQILAVHPSLPARSVKTFIGLAKSKPGALAYSSGGAGSGGHFAMELFALSTGLRMQHVPYRGAAPALTALLSGEVQAAFLVIPLVAPQLQSGKLRALGISSRRRSAVLPDVPTVQELGVKDFEALQWQGFFLPAKTSPQIVDRLYAGIAKALNVPEMKARAAAEGSEIIGSTPREFAEFFHREVVKYKEVAQRTGMKLD